MTAGRDGNNLRRREHADKLGPVVITDLRPPVPVVARVPVARVPRTARWRRFAAATQAQELIAVAAVQVLDGAAPADVLAQLRDNLAGVPLAWLPHDQAAALREREPRIELAIAGEISAAGGPEKWAGRITSWLLGRGANWFHDMMKRAPKAWRPKRRRYAPADARERRMRSHPGEFDPHGLTRRERLFLRLPAEVRQAVIAATVEACWTAPVQLVFFYELPPSRRNGAPVPDVLRNNVNAAMRRLAVAALASDQRKAVASLRRRNLSDRRVAELPLPPKAAVPVPWSVLALMHPAESRRAKIPPRS